MAAQALHCRSAAALLLGALLLSGFIGSSNAALKKYSAAAVAKHKSQSNCWVVCSGYVYNLSKYIKSNGHPRGNSIIKPWCGKDIAHVFDASHGGAARSQLRKYRVGKLA